MPDGTKLAVYGFRVLSTGQTTAYGYVVSADAKDTEYAAAGEGLNEWLNATDEKMKAAGASLVACAAEGTAPSEPKLIGELYLNYFYRSAATDEGMYGRLEFTSAWYWETQEESEAREHFFTTSQIKMTPGTYLSRNMYKNLHFLLTIDPDYSLDEVTSLPGVYTDDEQPHGTGDTTQAAWSVSRSGTGLSWTTDMPDSSLVFGRPAGQISVWEGRVRASTQTRCWSSRPGRRSRVRQCERERGTSSQETRLICIVHLGILTNRYILCMFPMFPSVTMCLQRSCIYSGAGKAKQKKPDNPAKRSWKKEEITGQSTDSFPSPTRECRMQ